MTSSYKEYYEKNKDALRAKSRAWYHANKERAQAAAAEWKIANPQRKQGHTRKYNLSKYGVTVEAYAQMLLAQKGRCAICNKSPAAGKNLGVDHNHKTGQIRALLCSGCNSGIGHFREDAATLRAAALYIERYK